MSKQIIAERTNLFEPNVYIGMYVEIDGNPPVELLKEAIQKAFQRNELTMSRVTIDEAVHKRYWDTHSSNILTHTFSKEETENIKDMARAIKVTVNNYIVILIIYVRKDLNEVGIPIDICEDDNSMSNQVSGIAINFKHVKKKGMQEKTGTIHKRIYKMINSPKHKYFVLLFMAELCPTLVDAAVLLASHGQTNNKIAEKAAYVMGYKGTKKRDLGVSNLGIIKMPTQYGKYKVNNIIFVPPSISYAKDITGISTINDRITINLYVYGNIIYSICELIYKNLVRV